MLPLRPPAQAMVSARSKKCREWDFGAGWVVASPFRAWRFSFVSEVAPTGTATDHGRHLVPCKQRLAALQPCQGAGDSPGTQAFYRVDLSLDFAEMVSPVHWTVENFFQCVGK